MTLKPSSPYFAEFTTSDPATGAAVNADSLPVATANHNGTDDGTFALTVANIDAGRYKVSGTVPSGYAKGDSVSVTVAATCSGIAGKAVIDRFSVDSKFVGDLNDSPYNGGAVASVTAPVTAGTVTDKTGYALATAPPTAAEVTTAVVAAMATAPVGSVAANVDANVVTVNDGAVTAFDGVLQAYTSGATDVVTLADTEPTGTIYGVGRLFETVGGTGPKQYAYGTAYDGSSKRLTLDRHLAVALDATTEYAITAPPPVGSVDAIQVEAGVNMRQAQSLILAASAGLVSGVATGPIVIKGGNTSTTRITATTDSAGNRTAITLNLP